MIPSSFPLVFLTLLFNTSFSLFLYLYSMLRACWVQGLSSASVGVCGWFVARVCDTQKVFCFLNQTHTILSWTRYTPSYLDEKYYETCSSMYNRRERYCNIFSSVYTQTERCYSLFFSVYTQNERCHNIFSSAYTQTERYNISSGLHSDWEI